MGEGINLYLSFSAEGMRTNFLGSFVSSTMGLLSAWTMLYEGNSELLLLSGCAIAPFSETRLTY